MAERLEAEIRGQKAEIQDWEGKNQHWNEEKEGLEAKLAETKEVRENVSISTQVRERVVLGPPFRSNWDHLRSL